MWAFLGDGEMDEPESLGAISLAAREHLDNLVFVINCNLQRLDGPVRGNGKIIQELEGVFRGAGWQVFKVIWGDRWDPLLAKDRKGLLVKRMEEAVDGDYQNYAARDGAWTPRALLRQVSRAAQAGREPLATIDIKRLNRGGHDPQKVYAAYHAAVHTQGQPVCILAKTVKGYGLGEAGEGKNPTHQLKKLGEEALIGDARSLPHPDLGRGPRRGPVLQSPRERPRGRVSARAAQGARRLRAAAPRDGRAAAHAVAAGVRADAQELGRARAIDHDGVRAPARLLLRNKAIADRIVPIVPDEARTFGMEGLFRQLGIYASQGQLYEPVDQDQVMYYREDQKGQILEEGITEAGALSSFIAAGTAYANYGIHMVPFFAFYSMFGFQRVGDLIWAAADNQARGFLIGATSGRTTLAGEGLQHCDGHSHVMASTVPNCVSYDPTYAYELAVIVQDGMRRMFTEQENVFYYVTVTNENYVMPRDARGRGATGIVSGMYLLRDAGAKPGPRVQLLGCGTILREVLAAADLLEKDFGVARRRLERDELHRARARRRRGAAPQPPAPGAAHGARATSSAASAPRKGPVVAATDYVRRSPSRSARFVPRRYAVLGTDGFGRSDVRPSLRRHFEVDRQLGGAGRAATRWQTTACSIARTWARRSTSTSSTRTNPTPRDPIPRNLCDAMSER